MTVDQLIEKYSGRIFLKHQHGEVSFHNFSNEVRAIVDLLINEGVQKGDVALIINIPLFQFPLLLFALYSLGAIAFPVSGLFTFNQIIEASKASGAKFVISKEKLDYLSCKWIDPNSFNQSENTMSGEITWNTAIPATILQTSGSSGQPKLVVHSLKNHFSSAQSVNSFFNISQNDSWLLTLPVYHVAGMALIFRCLTSGSTLCIPSNGSTLAENLKKYYPSHISLVPTQLWRLFESKSAMDVLVRCKAIFLGGSSISATLLQKSIDLGLKVFTSYGLTEAASTVAIKRISESSSDSAEILPCFNVSTNKKKEILLKGDPLFMGYYEKGNIQNPYNEKGWFATKDLGSIEHSKITILGRIDNMFISGGENIFPEEIEIELLKIDGIKQAVVVPKKDSEFGHRPVAFLDTDQLFLEPELKNQLRKNLPAYKIPNQILPWPTTFEEGQIKNRRNYFKSLI